MRREAVGQRAQQLHHRGDSQAVDAQSEHLPGGQADGALERMQLIKSEPPTFALSWTLFHPIDEGSPLFGKDEDTLAESEINFAVIIVGFDEASGQVVRATSLPRGTCSSGTNTWTSSGSMRGACATSIMRRSTRRNRSCPSPRDQTLRLGELRRSLLKLVVQRKKIDD